MWDFDLRPAGCKECQPKQEKQGYLPRIQLQAGSHTPGPHKEKGVQTGTDGSGYGEWGSKGRCPGLVIRVLPGMQKGVFAKAGMWAWGQRNCPAGTDKIAANNHHFGPPCPHRALPSRPPIAPPILNPPPHTEQTFNHSAAAPLLPPPPGLPGSQNCELGPGTASTSSLPGEGQKEPFSPDPPPPPKSAATPSPPPDQCLLLLRGRASKYAPAGRSRAPEPPLNVPLALPQQQFPIPAQPQSRQKSTQGRQKMCLNHSETHITGAISLLRISQLLRTCIFQPLIFQRQ